MDAKKKILIIIGIAIAVVIVLRSGLLSANAAILAENSLHLHVK